MSWTGSRWHLFTLAFEPPNPLIDCMGIYRLGPYMMTKAPALDMRCKNCLRMRKEAERA